MNKEAKSLTTICKFLNKANQESDRNYLRNIIDIFMISDLHRYLKDINNFILIDYQSIPCIDFEKYILNIIEDIINIKHLLNHHNNR